MDTYLDLDDAIKEILPDDLAKIGDPELIHSWFRKRGAIAMEADDSVDTDTKSSIWS